MPKQVSATCSACGKALSASAELVGRVVRCPSCHQKFQLSAVRFEADGTDHPSATETITGDGSGSVVTDKKAASETLGTIGRFQLRQQVGAGGFGIVYRAWDPELSREVALKIPRFSAADAVRMRRFSAESRAAANLRHPCIVAVFDAGVAGGQPYIAYEFVRGEPLLDRIRNRQFDVQQAAEWLRQLADALAYAHAEGIIHRDIKSENVLLNARSQPQILDFGLAKRLNEDEGMTTEGSLLGTPAYMSPEQARGRHEEVGPHSDQFSLGVVMFELLTGERPYSGGAHVVIAAIANDEETPDPAARAADIPRDLVAICRKCLRKDPSLRYADCAALADDLGRWLRGETISARRIGLIERGVRWARRNPAISTAVCTIAVALVSVAMMAIAVAAKDRRDLSQQLAQQSQLSQLNSTLKQQIAEVRKSEQSATQAWKTAEAERDSADEARRTVEEQKTIVESERDVSRGRLLENLLLQVDHAKARGNYAEAIARLRTAVEVAESTGDVPLRDALQADIQFLSLQVAHVPKLDDSTSPDALSDRQIPKLSRSPAGAALLGTAELPMPWLPEYLPGARIQEWNGRSWLVLVTDASGDGSFLVALAASEPTQTVWASLHLAIAKPGVGLLPQSRVVEIAPTPCGERPREFQHHAPSLTSAWIAEDPPGAVQLLKWTATDSPLTLPTGSGPLHSIWFSPDGGRLWIARRSASPESRLDVQSIRCSANGAAVRAAGSADTLQIINDGQHALIQERGRTRVFDLNTGSRVVDSTIPRCDHWDFRAADALLCGLAGSRLHTATGPSGASESYVLELPPEQIRAIVISPTGRMIEIQAHDSHYQIDLVQRRRFEPVPAEAGVEPQPSSGPPAGVFAGFLDEQRFAVLAPMTTFHRIGNAADDETLLIQKNRAANLSICQFGQAVVEGVPLSPVLAELRVVRDAPLDSPIDPEVVDPSRIVDPRDGLAISPNGAVAAVITDVSPLAIRLASLTDQAWKGPRHLMHGFLRPESNGTLFGSAIQSWGRGCRFSQDSQFMVYRSRENELGVIGTDTGERVGPALGLPATAVLLDAGFSIDCRQVWALAADGTTRTLFVWETVTGARRTRVVVLPTGEPAELYSVRADRLLELQSQRLTLTSLVTGELSETLSEGAASGRFSSDGLFVGCSDGDVESWFDARTGRACWPAESRPDAGTHRIPVTTSSMGVAAWQLSRPAERLQLWDVDRALQHGVELVDARGIVAIELVRGASLALTRDAANGFQLWDVASGRPLGPPLQDLVAWRADADPDRRRLQLSPSGDAIVATEEDHLAAVLPLPP